MFVHHVCQNTAEALKENLVVKYLARVKFCLLGSPKGEVNENVMAYSVTGHRHLPEINQELRRLKENFEPKTIFQPFI